MCGYDWAGCIRPLPGGDGVAISTVHVRSTQDMETTILSYLAKGFVVANKTPTSATLQKKKEFSILWAVVGLVLCLLPLLIYLIIYAMQPDVEIVEITVVNLPETA
jgi:hypothetical protein